MADFIPGDQVVHLIYREEGVVKALHLCRIGSNVLEAALVTVGKEERIWLCFQIELDRYI